MERIAVLFRSNPGTKPNPVKGFYTALAIFLPLIICCMASCSHPDRRRDRPCDYVPEPGAPR
jgi:hypothetical protein